MHNIKPYTKYKASGIAWLGDIPEHWEVEGFNKNVFLKHGFQFREEHFSKEGIRVVKITQLSIDGSLRLEKASYVPVSYKDTFKDIIINDGDILMALTGGTIGKIIRANINKEILLQNYRVGNFYPINDKLLRDFLYLQLKSEFIQAQMSFFVRETGQPNIGKGDFRKIKLIVPSTSEQTAIANFLDYKTAKIDRFIQKKKQLIKLLNEQKAGIINNAVTKGLDVNAKMKPSGIEWLGDIPVHWEVRKLKYVVTLNDETLNEKMNPEYELRYIDIGNVNENGKVGEIVNYKYKDAPSRARRIVKKGDVIISTVRTYLKAITQISDECENLIVSTGFAVLRPSDLIESDFLNYSVRANYFINRVCAYSVGVSYPAINASELIELTIAFPKREEQQAIVYYIETETTKLNQAIDTIEKEITLVQEYKTALIAEAVTGKIDVREYEIPVFDEVESYEEMEEEMGMVAEDGEENNEEINE